ncbi:hypothetical protein JTE90_000823 [Oedothorax gibbosus]|uniref:Gustatory receptor n=1 Tax=Oedothorax gibbosus TaxID=931172 RepID=A0AAV6VVD0_9ARAC|nr:hypothetical protein JTE90_000823 [Oedothorax gibbosus]
MVNKSFLVNEKIKTFKKESKPFEEFSEWNLLNHCLAVFGLRLLEKESSDALIKDRIWRFLGNVRLALVIFLNLIQLVGCVQDVIVSFEKRKPFIFSCCMFSVFAAQITTYKKKATLAADLKRISTLLESMPEGGQIPSMRIWLKLRCFAIFIHSVISFVCLSRYLSGERFIKLFGLNFKHPGLSWVVITVVNYIVLVHVVILTTFTHTIALLCCFCYEKERSLVLLWVKITNECVKSLDPSPRESFNSEWHDNQNFLLKIPKQMENFQSDLQKCKLSVQTNRKLTNSPEKGSHILVNQKQFVEICCILSQIAREVRTINQNLTQLNFFVVCVLLSVVSTTLNDLLLYDHEFTPVVLGYSVFCGVSNTFLFVYFVLKASNVLEEYSRGRTEILENIVLNSCVSRRYFSYFERVSNGVGHDCFLTYMKSMSPHFAVSCMGLFEFQKSVILTTFGCAVTYGVILMQMQ